MFKRFTAAAALAACAPSVSCAQQAGWPIPAAHGLLRVTVGWPADGASIAAADSIALAGSVGDGNARLIVAGRPVPVAANGAWLAWIAIPHDSSFTIPLQATLDGRSVTRMLHLVRAHWVREQGAWADRSAMTPTGDIWLPKAEVLPLAVRAAPGALVQLDLGDGRVIRFTPDGLLPPVLSGIRGFDHDDRNLARAVKADRYVASTTDSIFSLGSDLDSMPAPPGHAAQLVVMLNGDTTRTPWPLHVTRSAAPPIPVIVAEDPADSSGTQIVNGRATIGGTYSWFLLRDTRTRADMRVGAQVRLRLSHDAVAWVPLRSVRRAGPEDDPRVATMGTLTVTRDSLGSRLRIPLSFPVPFAVDEHGTSLDITLHNVVSDADWTRYGADNHFVKLLTWMQASHDQVRLTVELARPYWGWRAMIDGSDLVIRFREPPSVDSVRPLSGRRIVVDAGHPPGGACGPTGLCEPEVNLAIATDLRGQLAAAGAIVTMTRSSSAPLSLGARVALADSIDADLMVSIHNNAFPDGVNPLANYGSTTFFNHPQSIALARAVQVGLVAELAHGDLGVARGDYVLTRPTWYPAILTEGLYLVFPDQEAMLRTPAGQHRYATAIATGITNFLRTVH